MREKLRLRFRKGGENVQGSWIGDGDLWAGGSKARYRGREEAVWLKGTVYKRRFQAGQERLCWGSWEKGERNMHGGGAGYLKADAGHGLVIGQ